jgi:hypothetical protein
MLASSIKFPQISKKENHTVGKGNNSQKNDKKNKKAKKGTQTKPATKK